MAQYTLTALLSAFNAGYLLTRPWRERRHKTGAAVLAVVSLGVLVESLYFGLWTFSRRQSDDGDALAWLLAGGLGLAGALLVTALVARRHLR